MPDITTAVTSSDMNSVPDDLLIATGAPQHSPSVEESMEFHAARLLLLIKFAGGRRNRIVGRTKLAKLDFFVRYPSYLEKAAQIRGEPNVVIGPLRPESHMIRYKYGPWDSKYYNIFALLVAKALLEIHASRKGDVFQLTSRGEYAVDGLMKSGYEHLADRCKLVYKLFGDETGTAIKTFIYVNFPEIVAKELGQRIEK